MMTMDTMIRYEGEEMTVERFLAIVWYDLLECDGRPCKSEALDARGWAERLDDFRPDWGIPWVEDGEEPDSVERDRRLRMMEVAKLARAGWDEIVEQYEAHHRKMLRELAAGAKGRQRMAA